MKEREWERGRGRKRERKKESERERERKKERERERERERCDQGTNKQHVRCGGREGILFNIIKKEKRDSTM